MIRINLLGGDRQVRGGKLVAFDAAQRITLACSLILVLTAAGLGYWYWSLDQTSAQLDAIERCDEMGQRVRSDIAGRSAALAHPRGQRRADGCAHHIAFTHGGNSLHAAEYCACGCR